MMMRSVVIAALLCLAHGFCYANGGKDAEFNLTPEKILNVRVCRSCSPKYSVIVQLREPYKTDFSQFTGRNIGRRFDVTACGEILVGVVVKERIATGLVQIGFWNSQADAIKFGNELRGVDGQERCDELRLLLKVRYNGVGADTYVKHALGCLEQFEEHGDKLCLSNGLNFIKEAILADPDYGPAYYWKAFMLCKLNEIRKATESLDEGIKRSATGPGGEAASLYMFRGALELKSHQVRAAYSDYNRAVGIYSGVLMRSPKDWDAMMNTGIALILMNRRNDALDFAKRVVSAYPDDPASKELLEGLERFNVKRYLREIGCGASPQDG